MSTSLLYHGFGIIGCCAASPSMKSRLPRGIVTAHSSWTLIPEPWFSWVKAKSPMH